MDDRSLVTALLILSSLLKIIQMIDKALKWPLFSASIMDRWVLGKLVVLGDAAHAMLPYMSQGAAVAVEDGVALAHCLSKIEEKSQIQNALNIFAKVRQERASLMQQASLLNGKLWHFPDGPLQQARDAAMEPEVEGRPFSHSPNQWSDPATQMWCYAWVTLLNSNCSLADVCSGTTPREKLIRSGISCVELMRSLDNSI